MKCYTDPGYLIRVMPGNVEDPEPAMMEIAVFLEERTCDHFNNEEDPQGNAWPPQA